MYTEFTAGNRTYKLRLTSRGVVDIEKELGANPLQIFMGIDDDVLPKLSDMIIVLHRMLQPLEHGISRNDTYDIYDAFLADGHTMWDLVPILIEVFIESGFIPKEDSAEPKN